MVMNDGLLSVFILLSLYSFFFINNKTWSIILSSFALTLGFLTKPIGLLPVVAWVSYLIFASDKKEVLIKILKIGILSIVLIQIFWPESWFNPIFSIAEYLSRQYRLTKEATEIFFMGNVTNRAPFYYYLIQIMLRIPSYIFLGLLIALIAPFNLLSKKGLSKFTVKKNLVKLSTFIFVLVFFTSIAYSVKKSGIRYLLPIWPFLYFISCWAFFKYLFSKLKNKIVPNIVVFTFFIIALVNIYKYSPNYDYYYSELFGGPKTAQKYIATSLCYGAKESAKFINKCFPSLTSFVYIGCADTVIPYYFSGTVVSKIGNDGLLVVEEYYNQMGYLSKDEQKYINAHKPVVIEKNGNVLARIYNNNLALPAICEGI